MRVVRSAFAAATIFSANRDDTPIAAIEVENPEDALITRPELNVFVRWLSPGDAAFIKRLLDDATLEEAVEAAMAECSHFDLATNIQGMISAGAFADVIAPDQDR